MIITTLDATVDAGRVKDLETAYAAAEKQPRPDGLLYSHLLNDVRESTRWRIETAWDSMDSLQAMRGQGTPAGVLMFRAAGAEPTLGIWEVKALING